ncbi:MAG: hypothetical protein ACRCT8_12185 [Lacipirellulaceae bacterium]
MTTFCLFENGKSYDALQIAKLLGRTGDSQRMIRWVRENVFAEGCCSKKIGNLHVTTGDALNLWINQQADGWSDSRSSSEPDAKD